MIAGGFFISAKITFFLNCHHDDPAWNEVFSVDNHELTVRVDLSALTMGDSNFDGNVNILDIVLLVDAILGFHEPDSLEMYSSDLNSDNVLNILDVIALVNVILGG